MATVGVNWWGVVVTLDENETKQLAATGDVASMIGEYVKFAGALPRQ
jgi:hypothetical protein